jgi:hypothetical protein
MLRWIRRRIWRPEDHGVTVQVTLMPVGAITVQTATRDPGAAGLVVGVGLERVTATVVDCTPSPSEALIEVSA